MPMQRVDLRGCIERAFGNGFTIELNVALHLSYFVCIIQNSAVNDTKFDERVIHDDHVEAFASWQVHVLQILQSKAKN